MSTEMERAVEMVKIEVNGIALEAPKGSMIIEATDKVGIEIPRFCYHPKLSISASCRMCLVDVEKMPKPVPACATPVMDGMKVYTESRRAMDAQHGVMEFLLINHPLDCPICDQGGECELQDQAMGYGRSVSRFTERKRVVKDKDVGPLVQTEMTRCIHCTRCVRFLEEIAGTHEMGGSGRGDRLEIGTCVQNSINSELSGNIIDICPVGALTNKPYRFAARAWELMARPSVASHDGVGSSLFHHVRRGKILRTVPRENEATNESWLSDRDRYSHLGLYTEDRVTTPQIKENGGWKSVSWDEASERVAALLKGSKKEHGPEQTGVLMSPSAASEEYFLAQRLVRQLGAGNIDHRLREQDFSDDASRPEAPVFEKKIADIEHCDAILLVGCNPREDAPIIGHRVRQAWRKGAKISVVNPLAWNFTFDTSLDAIVAPQNMVADLAALAAAVERITGSAVPGSISGVVGSASVDQRHEALAVRLNEAENGLLLLGQFAMSHSDAAWLRTLSAYIGAATGGALNILVHGGNANGAWLAGAVPHRVAGGAGIETGMNAVQMLEDPRRCYLLWGIEPELDIDNPARAMGALRQAENVVSVVTHASESLREVSDVLLPLAALAESEGSMVNFDGNNMGFRAAAKKPGDARPGWKILRRIGSEMNLEGFDQFSIEEVSAEMQSEISAGSVSREEAVLSEITQLEGLYRIGEVPMYSIDATCRRSGPLQETIQASQDLLGLNPQDAERLGLADGANARVSQGGESLDIRVDINESVPAGGAWLRTANDAVCKLGPAVAPVNVEVA